MANPTATHAYNHGLVTSMKGPALEACRITALNVAPGPAAFATVAEQCRSNFIQSVLHSATGIYTFQLALPYPPAIITITPTMSNANGTTDIIIPAYQSGSYNATTGQFIINLMNDDDVGAPVLVDGNATDELHVVMLFRRYTT